MHWIIYYWWLCTTVGCFWWNTTNIWVSDATVLLLYYYISFFIEYEVCIWTNADYVLVYLQTKCNKCANFINFDHLMKHVDAQWRSYTQAHPGTGPGINLFGPGIKNWQESRDYLLINGSQTLTLLCTTSSLLLPI